MKRKNYGYFNPSAPQPTGDGQQPQPAPVSGNIHTAETAPTANDDSSGGYEVGMYWYDSSTDTMYKLEDATEGAAVWTVLILQGEEPQEPDYLAPTVANPVLTVSPLYSISATVNFDSASDNQTEYSELLYYLYYSTQDNLNTDVATVEANGTLADQEINTSSLVAENLIGDTQYWFNIVVEDVSGNKAIYTPVSVTTPSDVYGEFATVLNQDFYKDGGIYKFSGTNAYYLPNYQIIDETVVDRAFAAFDAAGAKVIRMWAFYDGPPQYDADTSIQPEARVYNEAGLVALDQVIAKGKALGMTFMLPFINYWEELGGVPIYNGWAGIVEPDVDYMTKFINSTEAQSIFEDYITMLLNRVNTVTGVAYKNEPAIFCWEVGNEIRNPAGGEVELRDWYRQKAQFIKSIDGNHMVSTGEEGFDEGSPSEYQIARYSNDYAFRAQEGTSYILNTAIPEIDFGHHHWYPAVFGIGTTINEAFYEAQEAWFQDHDNIAIANGKPSICGEYGLPGWGDERVLAAYTHMYQVIENEGIAGSLLWQLAADFVKCYEFGGNICYPDARGDYEIYNEYFRHTLTMNGIPDTSAPQAPAGALTFTNIGTTTVTLNTPGLATDGTYDQLKYEVYWSDEANLDGSPEQIEQNGTKGILDFGDTFVNKLMHTTTFDVVGLWEGEEIFFNVIATDGHGNKTSYTMSSVAMAGTADIAGPTATSYALSITNVSYLTMDVAWVKASDDRTLPAELWYEVYVSDTEPLNSVQAILDYGTLKFSGYDVANASIDGLTPGVAYSVNVMVTDERGNRTIYSYQSVTTVDDVTAPTVADATLIPNSINDTKFKVNFNEATDDVSASLGITYSLYYSLTDNLNTDPATVKANGTLADQAMGTNQLTITGLSVSTLYYVNVIASDEAGNEMIYISNSATTASTPVPIIHEWDGAGMALNTAGEVTAWDDNIGPLSLAIQSSDGAPLLNADGWLDPDGNDYLYMGSGLNYVLDDFVIAVAVDLEKRADYRQILNLAAAGTAGVGAYDPGGLRVGVDTDRDIDGLAPRLTCGFNGNSLFYGFRHYGGECVIWMRRSSATGEFELGLSDGVNPVVIDTSVQAAPTVAADRMAILTALSSDGGFDATSAGLTPIKAINMWDRAGTIAERDTWIADMVAANISAVPADLTAPVIADPVLTSQNINSTDFQVTFAKATDDETPQANIVYEIYTSLTDNLNTDASTVEANGVLRNSATDVTVLTAAGVSQDTLYYVNVLAVDEAGNKNLYTSTSVQTITDTTNPVNIWRTDQGLVLVGTTDEVSYWQDTVAGVNLDNFGNNFASMFYNSVDNFVEPQSDQDYLYGSGISVPSNDYMVCMVIDTTTPIDWRAILGLAKAGAESAGVDGGAVYNASGGAIDCQINNQLLTGMTLPSSICVLTLRVAGTIGEYRADPIVGFPDPISIVETLTAPPSGDLLTMISANTEITAEGAPLLYGSNTIPVRAIQVWASGGDATIRDGRIADMITQYSA